MRGSPQGWARWCRLPWRTACGNVPPVAATDTPDIASCNVPAVSVLCCCCCCCWNVLQAGALRLEGFSTRVGKVMPITLENCVLANNRPAQGALVSVLVSAAANMLPLAVFAHSGLFEWVGVVCSARAPGCMGAQLAGCCKLEGILSLCDLFFLTVCCRNACSTHYCIRCLGCPLRTPPSADHSQVQTLLLSSAKLLTLTPYQRNAVWMHCLM